MGVKGWVGGWGRERRGRRRREKNWDERMRLFFLSDCMNVCECASGGQGIWHLGENKLNLKYIISFIIIKNNGDFFSSSSCYGIFICRRVHVFYSRRRESLAVQCARVSVCLRVWRKCMLVCECMIQWLRDWFHERGMLSVCRCLWSVCVCVCCPITSSSVVDYFYHPLSFFRKNRVERFTCSDRTPQNFTQKFALRLGLVFWPWSLLFLVIFCVVIFSLCFFEKGN